MIWAVDPIGPALTQARAAPPPRLSSTVSRRARPGLAVPCLLLMAATGLFACAAPRLRLPEGPGRPLADVSPVLAEATAACSAVRSLTAEIALSGRAGAQRIRGRVIAGLDRGGNLRLEAPAPFGAPVFVLVARGGAATLLLPRERRVLEGEPPAAVVEALTGLALDPSDLLAVLAGCPPFSGAPRSGQAYGDRWIAADVDGETVHVERREGYWRVRSWTRKGLRVEYIRLGSNWPQRIGLRVESASGTPAAEMVLAVSGVEVNADLPARAFEVLIPAGTAPLTLEELRASVPIGRDARPVR